ncbi:energy transducer TonB [Ensifer adhaerens]|uniref:energy transducer TonB n=1 Tax=Ensifer adhaerens TaxID=106592 RepID=UPI001F406147|nr:TonB family protein [Ensifer adhaerens]
MKILLPLLCAAIFTAGALAPAHAASSKKGHEQTDRSSKHGQWRTLVRFVVEKDGGLSLVTVHRSSGNRKVDAAAIDAVRRAAPFPKHPTGRREYRVEMVQER